MLIKTVLEKKMRREILQEMKGGPGIINFVDAYQNTAENYIAFVMELVEVGDTNYMDFGATLTDLEIR